MTKARVRARPVSAHAVDAAEIKKWSAESAIDTIILLEMGAAIFAVIIAAMVLGRQ